MSKFKCSVEIVCSWPTNSMSYYSWEEGGRGIIHQIPGINNIKDGFNEGYAPALPLAKYCDTSEGIYDAYYGWKFVTRPNPRFYPVDGAIQPENKPRIDFENLSVQSV